MHNVKEDLYHCRSPGEIRGTLAPNTERRPEVPRRCMQCAEEEVPCYSRKTGRPGKMPLAFEYRPVMMTTIDTELGEAAGRCHLAFRFPAPVRFVLLSVLQTLQYKETSERVGKK
jgi:hypothetical protein